MRFVAPKLIIAALAVATLLWPRPAIAPIAAQQSPTDRVTVEHELIRVDPSPVAQPRAARPRASGAVRLAVAQKPTPQVPPERAVHRAKRMLFGDGRYRPQPFPRPGR